MYIFQKAFVYFFHFLIQFPLTTSETELDYYHQKVYVRVTSRFTERAVRRWGEP